MGSRLNENRQKQLEPKRIEHAVKKIQQLGYTVHFQDNTKIIFTYREHPITLFPYSGWHTGKTIKDGSINCFQHFPQRLGGEPSDSSQFFALCYPLSSIIYPRSFSAAPWRSPSAGSLKFPRRSRRAWHRGSGAQRATP